VEVDAERQLIAALFSKFADRIQVDSRGHLTMDGPDWDPVATASILRSVQPNADVTGAWATYRSLRAFIENAEPQKLREADLAIAPPQGIHFADAGDKLFYDFVNTDRTLSELVRSGAGLKGNMLDFGCSSGRNVAVVRRANFPGLSVFGCDPVPSSIEWAQQNIPGGQFSLSKQDPPLPYADEMFDLVYAKSIWTHFSSGAARAWMEEIARVL
jgi:SAM-dependent methyltransferase